mmetsp:Transcript_62935/g.124375  ORF Transcript_62935/g.124375 Transcript_62935/m.124375 type:complete len:145 (-) Transcript_62935:81-515(-)
MFGRLAKAIGEMTAAEAIDYLAGPEPRKAGISVEVIEALRHEILNAVEAAKRAAAAEAERGSESSTAQGDETPASTPQTATMTGPADDSAEEMRKWRAYCAQALAAAKQVGEQGSTSQAVSPPLFKPRVDGPPLFKPGADKDAA